MRAVVTAAPGNDEAFDRGLADQAGLAFATIHAMPKLEKTFFAIRAYVIGNRRTTHFDGLAQDRLYCGEKAFQIRS